MSPWSLALMQRVRSEHGLDLSPTKIERLRGWRVIPGRPPGSRTRWRSGLAGEIPDAEVQQVADAARFALEWRSKDEVTVAMAVVGWPIDPAVVASSVRSLAERIVGRHGRSDTAYGAARGHRRPLLEEITERLRAHGESEDVLEQWSPYTGTTRLSARGYFEALEKGIEDGEGPAGHLGSALETLADLTDDAVVDWLRVIRQLSFPAAAYDELNASVPRGRSTGNLSPVGLVAQLLNLLTQPGEWAGQLRAMQNAGAG